jgi:hypothetical protein
MLIVKEKSIWLRTNVMYLNADIVYSIINSFNEPKAFNFNIINKELTIMNMNMNKSEFVVIRYNDIKIQRKLKLKNLNR